MEDSESVVWIGSPRPIAFLYCYLPTIFWALMAFVFSAMVYGFAFGKSSGQLMRLEVALVLAELFLAACVGFGYFVALKSDPIYALTNRRLILSFAFLPPNLGGDRQSTTYDGRIYFAYGVGALGGAQVRQLPSGTGNIDLSRSISIDGKVTINIASRRDLYPMGPHGKTIYGRAGPFPRYLHTRLPAPAGGAMWFACWIFGVPDVERVGRAIDDAFRHHVNNLPI